MKSSLRSLFSFLLTPLESGSNPYSYKKMNRIILIIIGVLFAMLTLGIFFVFTRFSNGDPAYLIPALIFGSASALCFIVGFLGNERAIARIWGGNR